MTSLCLNTTKAVFPDRQKKYFHHPCDTSLNFRASHLKKNFFLIFLHLYGNEMSPKTYPYPAPTSTPELKAHKFLQLIPA